MYSDSKAPGRSWLSPTVGCVGVMAQSQSFTLEIVRFGGKDKGLG